MTALLGLCVAFLASANVVSAGTVSFGLKKQAISPPNSVSPIVKRDGVSIEMDNRYVGYFSTLEVGTPAQKLSVHVDTGSSDLWFMGKGNPYCMSSSESQSQAEANGQINCTGLVFFDANASSTLEQQDDKYMEISYLDTTFAVGPLVKDTLTLGNTTVDDAMFSVASKYNVTQGIFGIGFPNQEAVYNSNGKPQPYNNVPAMLQSSGAIDTVAYSLYLNSVEESDGSLLFGGVDHSKYNGSLTVVPMVANYDLYNSSDIIAMFVEISSLAWNLPTGDSEMLFEGSEAAVLDSGSTLCRLPRDTFLTLLYSLGGQYVESMDAGLVECNLAKQYNLGTLEFQFNSAVIEVDLVDFLIPLTSDGQPYVDDDGNEICMIGASPSEDLVLLGDSFLHNAYVVYDLENKVVGLAQASLDVTDSDIETIGSNGIPSATTDSTASFMSTFSGLEIASAATLSIPASAISGSAGTIGSVTATTTAAHSGHTTTGHTTTKSPATTTESTSAASPSASATGHGSSASSHSYCLAVLFIAMGSVFSFLV